MSTLGDLWTMVGAQYLSPGGVIALAQQHDTLATGQGYARPANVREPRSWDTGTRATAADVNAWETWYNDAAGRGGLPQTAVFAEQVATGTPWNTLLTNARTRNAPTAVQAYFSIASDAWNSMRTSVQPALLADSIRSTITEAERAIQAWWFRRLGGESGTPAAFPRGDGAGGGGMQPIAPPSTPATPATSQGIGLNGDTALKALGLYIGYKIISKGRRGRR